MPRIRGVRLGPRQRREVTRRQDRDARSAAGAVAPVGVGGRSGRRGEAEREDVAGGDHPERVFGPRRPVVLPPEDDGDEGACDRDDEQGREPLQREANARLRRSHRRLEDGRDLLVRELVEEGPADEVGELARRREAELREATGPLVVEEELDEPRRDEDPAHREAHEERRVGRSPDRRTEEVTSEVLEAAGEGRRGR